VKYFMFAFIMFLFPTLAIAQKGSEIQYSQTTAKEQTFQLAGIFSVLSRNTRRVPHVNTNQAHIDKYLKSQQYKTQKNETVVRPRPIDQLTVKEMFGRSTLRGYSKTSRCSKGASNPGQYYDDCSQPKWMYCENKSPDSEFCKDYYKGGTYFE